MAGSLLILLDDIASVLDDVAAMTKVAAKKTAGVLGDDLALNAKQVAGVRPTRELAVVWGVARGSAVNKLILVPAALAISWAAPWAIQPLLILGGAFLCYEGAEKILHRLLHGKPPHDHAAGRDHGEAGSAREDGGHADDERKRVAAAIRTDFILSAEIIVITLGVVAGRPLTTQLAVMTAISIGMTVGVYGLVAAIVKLDDLGALLATGTGPISRRPISRWIGRGILAAAPRLMRALSVAGTAAMFLVGGGIIAHALPAVHEALHDLVSDGWLPALLFLADGVIGVVVGLLLVAVRSLLPRAHPARAVSRPASSMERET